MKLLLVDDEQIERDALQAILEKNFSNLVIKQARNGRIAIQIAAEFQPDLVLMDIQMPGINGLEAVEKIHQDYPHIKVIMISAYATFDYAHSAIQLGVVDYMVKPSKISDIVKTIGRVLIQIEEERMLVEKNRHQQETLEKALSIFETDIVTQLLFDHVHEVHVNELVDLLGFQTTKEKFVISLIVPKGSEECYSAIREKVRQVGNGWIGALNGRQIPIIVFRNQEQSYRTQATLLTKEIMKLAKSSPTPEWFIGIGNVYRSLDQIRQSYQESLIATRDTTVAARYRFYSDLSVPTSCIDDHSTKDYEQQLFDFLRSGKWEEIHFHVINVINRYEQKGSKLLETQQRLMELLWVVAQVLGEMGIEVDSPIYSFHSTDFRQLRAEANHLLERLQKSYEEHYEKLGEDTIKQIKQYIIEHAHQDISLDAIGRLVGLNPIYISKLFKEQLGVNYIHFLTECRIDKAKKLMRDPEKSLKEITYEVGYHDPNYFSKVFKKMCHVSPTEYRKDLHG